MKKKLNISRRENKETVFNILEFIYNHFMIIVQPEDSLVCIYSLSSNLQGLAQKKATNKNY